MATNIRMVQSVDKAITLLECLAQSGESMSLSDLSSITGWAKSTIHGLLYTMRLRGLIKQYEDSGKYWLGEKLTYLGNIAGQRTGDSQ